VRLLTHVYLANLLIDELASGGGKLRIPDAKGDYSSGTLREPFPSGNKGSPKMVFFPTKGGDYRVPDDVVNVILENEDYFRGGAAGCDTLPDIMFSQMLVHPFESGMWLEYLFDRFRALPKGKERGQVYAFILGMMTHYATDMFGHAYVNEYAGGWFDDIIGERGSKHLLVEEYIDYMLANPISEESVIPKKRRTIAVPTRFLATCFADALGIEWQIGKVKSEARSKELLSTYRGKHLDPLRTLSFKYSHVENGHRMAPNEILSVKTISEKVGRMEKWVEAWTNITRKALNEEIMELAFPPDILKQIGDTSIFEEYIGNICLTRDRQKITEAIDVQFEEKEVPRKLQNDLKKFGKEKKYPYGEEGEFKAFSLCLTASKFCIMGYSELNRYLGCDPVRPDKWAFNQDRSKHSLRRLRMTVKFDKDVEPLLSDGSVQCGVEVTSKDGRTMFSTLLGPEAAGPDEILIELPSPIPYEELARFILFIGTEDFSCGIERFRMTDADAEKTIAEMPSPCTIEPNKDCGIETDQNALEEIIDSMGQAEAINVPYKIMSWLYSLDGRDRELGEKDQNYTNPSRKPWEYQEYAIFHDLPVKKSFTPGLQSNLLSEEYDDVMDKPVAKKEKVSPSRAKKDDSFDIAITPEGNMMDIAFERKSDTRMRPSIQRAKPPAEKGKAGEKETDKDKKTQESAEKTKDNPGVEETEKSDTEKTKYKGDPDEQSDLKKDGTGKAAENGGSGVSKKEDGTNTDKTADGEGSSRSKDDAGAESKNAEEGPKDKKDDGGDKSKKDEDAADPVDNNRPQKSKEDGGMDKEGSDGKTEKDNTNRSSKKDISEEDDTTDKDDAGGSPKKKDNDMNASEEKESDAYSNKKDDGMNGSTDKDNKKEDPMDKNDNKEEDPMDKKDEKAENPMDKNDNKEEDPMDRRDNKKDDPMGKDDDGMEM